MPDNSLLQRVKPDVTYGNIVSWVIVVIGFVYGYSQLNSKVDHIAVTLLSMQQTDTNLQSQINAQRDIGTARQIDISTKMTRLETILERIDGKADRLITPIPKSSIQ